MVMSMELKRYRIIILGIIILTIYWITENYIHSSFYRHNYFEHFDHVSLFELLTRFIFSCFFIISTIFLQISLNKVKDSEDKVRKAYDLNIIYKNLFAHDIRNIMNNINSSNQLMKLHLNNYKNNQKLTELIDIIDNQVVRSDLLISNIISFSKLDIIKNDLKLIEVLEVLKKSKDFIKESFSSKNINIELNNSEEKIYVKANEFLLDLFENILHNAIKYNDKNIIKISINISKEELDNIGYLKLEFKDNGIGIPDNRKKNIFQLNYESKSSEGLSLGLSLVNKIINSINGKIWVEDIVKGDYSRGSNFIMLIPRSPIE